MDITFNPETQYLEFKEIYILKAQMITVFRDGSVIWTVDPNNTEQSERQNLWNSGLKHIWDVIDITSNP